MPYNQTMADHGLYYQLFPTGGLVPGSHDRRKGLHLDPKAQYFTSAAGLRGGYVCTGSHSSGTTFGLHSADYIILLNQKQFDGQPILD